ncbi:MAG TPA: hypothetical protein VEL76_16460 [Gemmataceae bacterium]|nr:hypothetical protein [Gemmataceae bacterium]
MEWPQDDPRRVQILKEHADAVLEITQRAFGAQVLHEMEHLR